MPHFICDNTELAAEKSNFKVTSVPATQKIREEDWNEHRQAFVDIQQFLRNELLAISVKNYGAVGDGITDDTAALQAAATAATAGRFALYFPPNTSYLITDVVLFGAATALRLVGQGSTIKYASSTRYAFSFNASTQSVIAEGLGFEGNTADDDANTNFYAALLFPSGVTEVWVDKCKFVSCLPATWVTSETSARFRFTGNYVKNAPNGLPAPSYSVIDGNWFMNDEVVATRSHAIYPFGQTEKLIITNNHFKNIAGQDVQIRSGSSVLQQKHSFIIANNIFERSGSYSIWVGSDTGTHEGSFSITGNVFKNCNGPIFCQGLRNSVIANNVLEYDYTYPVPAGSRATGTAGITVTSGIGQAGQLLYAKNVQIANNIIVNRHPWFARFTLDTVPLAGETITIGAEVYTFVNSAAVAGDVERVVGDVNSTAQNLWNEVIGRGFGPMNSKLREPSDLMYSPNALDGTLVMASGLTFALSTTSSAITINDAPTDNTDVVYSGVLLERSLDCSVIGGEISDIQFGVELNYNIAPRVADVTVNVEYGGVVGILGYANTRSVYSGIRLRRSLNPTQGRARVDISVYDGFPVFINCDTITEQKDVPPELQGNAGYVTAGTGEAYAYVWFGDEVEENGPQSLSFRWNDGDQVFLDGTAPYTFTFKRDSPGAGEFNDRASLIALIDGKAEYEAVAIEAPFNNGYDTGYFRVRCVGLGAGGNAGWVRVSTLSRLNGVVLNDTYNDDGVYRTFFHGGAAAATKTFVETPLADVSRPVFVQGVDSAAQTLNPIVYQADIIPGVGFVITHDAASGGEQFFWRAV